MKPITLACLLLAVSSVFAFDEPVRPPKGTTCGDSILAFYEEGPNFANAAQVYPEHAKYITDLLGQGKAAAAGKMKDANKALIIVRTKDITEAQAWVNQDPFVQKGRRQGVVHGVGALLGSRHLGARYGNNRKQVGRALPAAELS